MASPFAAEDPAPDPMADPGGAAPGVGEEHHTDWANRARIALALLSSLATVSPIGKGLKGAALGALPVAAGMEGSHMLGATPSPGAEGEGSGLPGEHMPLQQHLQMAEAGAAPPLPGAPAPGPEAPPAAAKPPEEPTDSWSDRVKDIKEELHRLRNQLPAAQKIYEQWNGQAMKGGYVKPETSKALTEAKAAKDTIENRISELGTELGGIGRERATIAGNARKLAKQTADAEDAKQARIDALKWGGGIGAGVGAAAALANWMSRGKAVKAFEKGGERIGSLIGFNTKQGLGELGPNVALSQRTPELESAINRSYQVGGAKGDVLPSLDDVYGSKTKKELDAAKQAYREQPMPLPPFTKDPEASKILPSWLGGTPSRVEEPGKLNAALNYAPAGIGLGEAGIAYGTGQVMGQDNPETQRKMNEYALMGITAGSAAKISQLGLKFMGVGSKMPNELARQAVQAGLTRMRGDVQKIDPKALQAFNKLFGVGKGFKPGSADAMATARDIKSGKTALHTEWANANQNAPQVKSALTAATDLGNLDAAGRPKIDLDTFHHELRRQFGGDFVDHNGGRIKIDRQLARRLLQTLGQQGA